MTATTVRDLPPTPENIARAGFDSIVSGGFVVSLAERRRNARSHVRLYHAPDGTPYVRDRLHGRRDVVAIRVIVLDGQELNMGAAVLATVSRVGR